MRPREEKEQVLQLYLKEHLGYKVIANRVGVPFRDGKELGQKISKGKWSIIGQSSWSPA